MRIYRELRDDLLLPDDEQSRSQLSRSGFYPHPMREDVKQKQAGGLQRLFLLIGGTMSQVPIWFERKFEFSFPVCNEVLNGVEAHCRGLYKKTLGVAWILQTENER
jgi:hypothetical protein